MRLILSTVVVLALLISCSTPEPPKRPSIVFILADDLGVHDTGFGGTSFYETPNLDSLAEHSVVFTQGYAASRVCSPSRASILTGQFTATHGITDWIGAPSGTDWRKLGRHDKLLPAAYRRSLDSAAYTLPEILKDAGYKTFFAGKWHLGGEGSYPTDHGFDVNVGGWEKGSPIGGYFSPWENPFLPNHTEGESLTLRLADETVQFIQSTEDPFFAFLSFYTVHAPLETTSELLDKYKRKALGDGIAEDGFVMEDVLPLRVVQDNPVYAGMVETMDEAIGRVLAALPDPENTIIIFTSDNGGVASGDAYATSNLPLRGGKGYMWEGGIRDPFTMHIPGYAPATIEDPVVSIDFYPTLLDLAGIPVPTNVEIDGESLVSLVNGNPMPQRNLFWHYPHYGNQGGQPSSIIRQGQWKLIHYWEDGHEELYDLENDPGEMSNVYAENSDIAKKLSSELFTFLKRTDAILPIADPEYDSALRAKRLLRNREVLWPRLEGKRLEILDADY